VEVSIKMALILQAFRNGLPGLIYCAAVGLLVSNFILQERIHDRESQPNVLPAALARSWKTYVAPKSSVVTFDARTAILSPSESCSSSTDAQQILMDLPTLSLRFVT
jgi:hypothetical protein